MKKVFCFLLCLFLVGCSSVPVSRNSEDQFNEPLYRKKPGYHFQQVMPMYYERETITEEEYRILPEYIKSSYERLIL